MHSLEREPSKSPARPGRPPSRQVDRVAGTPGEHAESAQGVLQLQRLVGNRAMAIVVQRSVDTAAQALKAQQKKKVPTKAGVLNKFLKDHEIAKTDVPAVQSKLDELWEASRAEQAAAIARKKRDDGLAGRGQTPDGSYVGGTKGKVEAWLDGDQLKHQDAINPIGTRQKGGGTKFTSGGTAAWHRQHTVQHMLTWAEHLEMEHNPQNHGQAEAVDGIHYEGHCVEIDGKRYVFFHCYPERGSKIP